MMVAALVIIGATACTETEESLDKGNNNVEEAGVSFYATFGDADTRAYIDDSDGDNRWTTVWEEGDLLDVTNTADYSSYTFVCTDAATGKFTCEDSAAATLIGQTVLISSDNDKHPRDSRLGKKALSVWTTGVEFTQDATIQLSSDTSFFRYTYEGEGDVTLKLELQSDSGADVKSFSFFDNETEGLTYANEITFSGIKGENFVPFWCGIVSPEQGVNATLSYAIDGVIVKQTTINSICSGKVYNLGTLTDPEPAAKIYLVPNDGWKADGAWFSAHFFNSVDGFADVKMTDDNGDGIYECSVPADMEMVLFCRMNPAYTEFAWNEEGATDENLHVWDQTADETIGVEPDNYYYILDWATGIWGNKDGYELPVRTLGIIGLGGNWDVDTDMTLEGDYYTLKSVAVTATDSFKVRANDAWTENYGIASSATVDAVAIEKDTMYSLVQDGKNMQLAAGTYDFYFNDTTKEFYAMTPGTTPEVEPIVWSLAGSFNSWGDTLMAETETANLYVAKGVELKSGDEIKVKDSKTWDTSYGGGINNLEANKWMKAYFNGSNVVVAKSGAYDVYFEYAEGAEYSKLYLIEAEGDYTTATEQTANGTLVPDGGEEPEQPEVTPGEASEWGVVGTFQGWDVAAPLNMVTDVDGWVVLRGLELYKDDEIKIVKGTSWDGNYGLDAAADLDVDVEHALKQGGQSNIGCAKNGKFDIYFNANTAKFKYVCVEEYTDLTVNITIDNKANWSPLRLMLKHGDTLLTAAEGDEVTGTTYTISGDYIGATLTYQFFTDGKQSEAASLTVTKSGATITLEETIVKLTVQLNTANSKQWWGTTMKIHVWGTGTSFDTSWPGNAMTYDGNYTWHVIVPSELVGKSINYLVHNGNGWQSKDSMVTIKAEGVTVTGSSIGIN